MTPKPPPTKTVGNIDCDSDPTSISVDAAQQLIKQAVSPLTEIETIATRAALGRIAATDIKSRVQVPNHTNSAMDGYAVKGSDLSAKENTTLTMIGTAMAGKAFQGELNKGECVRIMTGAVLPNGADSVVMQEHVEREGDSVIVQSGEKAGSNVRYAGEDLEIGDIAITAGQRLNPSHLGVAASLGFAELPVVRLPRVAFFSTGDELRAVGEPLACGEVYDSNRYTLYGMLHEMGVEIVDLGIVPDQPDALAATFEQAADCADMIITTAGASVGEADYVMQSAKQLGDLSFWKVAVKPGRPIAFGKLRERLFFGLPGNPVSVMVTFQVFVKPALRLLSGETPSAAEPLQLQARTLSALRKRPGRMEYQRGILTTDPDNPEAIAVRSTGEQGSGILRSMSEANCFIILPNDSAEVSEGDIVTIQPF